ncbi:rhamnogalacturonan acetylesterase [Mucilaginibacter sp. RS28]|uniref:Rhamnogalacturonan acetylesterase n=1 Tax=Mucilaginibacter straminoryzae TaxID=2932774 RepID=A0A9X1X448_9SPHI|nr:rhamnogalacturonan acetylesterase [Mucilaginibacter straminoryzae]MCJ8210832.1 rhamnogalacturonan acetylesterase [Mucilaginibacter straminoryzae]
MNKKLITGCLLLAAAFALAFTLAPSKATIYMIGDSTMSVKEKKAYPETGWGMPFANFFDSTITIDNRARNGRSTRTFVEEGLWKPVAEGMKPGDYLLIQFGHNDEVPTKKSYTTPEDYKKYLLEFVNTARQKKAVPVLITPVARRTFDQDGKLKPSHPEYSQYVRDVAKANNVLLIDLDQQSQNLLRELGPEKSVLLFNHLAPGEHPNYPDGKQDDTHFNELGARRMAELVLADLVKILPDLDSHIARNKPVMK